MRFWNMATVMALKPGTRPLQQILFDTADGVTPPPASSPPAAARPGSNTPPNRSAEELPPARAAGTSPAGSHPAGEYGCPIQAHTASIPQMIIVSNRGAEWLICARTKTHSYLHGSANTRRSVSGYWDSGGYAWSTVRA